MIEPLPVDMPESVASALTRSGRAEDCSFSPDNRRLALAGYHSHTVLVLDIEIVTEPLLRVVMTGATLVQCDRFAQPHGVAFLDGRLLAVANRKGAVTVIEVPAPAAGERTVTVDPVLEVGISGDCPVRSPGSVTSIPVGDGLFELLVCNNYVHKVTRHVIDTMGPDGPRVISDGVLIGTGVRVPDGVAVSPDQELLVVSNHDLGAALVYANEVAADGSTPCVGALRGIGHPHGLQFTPDGRWVLVADAGRPVVHVYAADEPGWTGDRDAVAEVQVVLDVDYRRSSHMPGEGGPKGLTIDGTGRVLVMSGEHLALSFHEVARFTGEQPGQRRAVRGAGASTRAQVLREVAAAAALRERLHAAQRTVAERDLRIEVLEKLVNGLFGRVEQNSP